MDIRVCILANLMIELLKISKLLIIGDKLSKEDLGILIGLLLTDRCVSEPKTIVFHNKAEFHPRTSNENITLERKEDILEFSKNVRFIHGIKIGGDSKFLEGFEKNQILDLAVKTLDFKKQDMKKIKTKKNGIAILKSCISTI